jgi:hypothetical protein
LVLFEDWNLKFPNQLSSLDKEENEFAVVITKAKKEEFESWNLVLEVWNLKF